MRRKLIVTTTTAGVLALGGLAVAVPALADTGATGQSAVGRVAEALAGLVEDGSLTQEQADEVATTLEDAGIGGPGGPGGRPDLAAAATALGMTEDELRTALDVEGTSLADVADQQGVPVDTVVQALVTAAQEHLADAVADGDLTQEQADERLADVTERVTERVQSDAWGGGRGPGGRGPWGPGGPAEDD